MGMCVPWDTLLALSVHQEISMGFRGFVISCFKAQKKTLAAIHSNVLLTEFSHEFQPALLSRQPCFQQFFFFKWLVPNAHKYTV